MLMYWIIGAVVSGIIMFVANNKAKMGAAWGQPVSIIFGILAIAFALLAMKTNGEKPSIAGVETGYQYAQAYKVGKWVAENCSDKKILFLADQLSPEMIAKGIQNPFAEGFKAGMKDVAFETLFAPPLTEEVANSNLNWSPKHFSNMMKGKDWFGKDYENGRVAPEFDILVTSVGMPDGSFRGAKCSISELQNKGIVVLNGYSSEQDAALKDGVVLAVVENKNCPDLKDTQALATWDQVPPKDMDKAFDIRYIFHTSK